MTGALHVLRVHMCLHQQSHTCACSPGRPRLLTVAMARPQFPSTMTPCGSIRVNFVNDDDIAVCRSVPHSTPHTTHLAYVITSITSTSPTTHTAGLPFRQSSRRIGKHGAAQPPP